MKTILFCLPYAGGSATVYHAWKAQLHDRIELHPVELPGRGSRYDEPFANDMEQLVNDTATYISEHAGSSPYLLYGHSMGAVLAYELYDALMDKGCRIPEGMILSGRPAPSYSKASKWSGFKDKVLSWFPVDDSRIPAEIAAHPQLASAFKRILEADIQMMSRYRTSLRQSPLKCPLVVLAGKQDTIAVEAIEAWQTYTCQSFQMYWLDGDHFFIHSQMSEVLDIVNTFVRATAYK